VSLLPKVSPDLQAADLLIAAAVPPLQVGVYVDGRLVETHRSDAKTSEALPAMLAELSNRYTWQSVAYVRGPGSFMAVKVAFVTARTLSIALDIPLYGCEAFDLNGHAPVKAVGRSCFVKEGGRIVVRPKCDAADFRPLVLPESLEALPLTENADPLYVLPAV
jgi:hypothetical protein